MINTSEVQQSAPEEVALHGMEAALSSLSSEQRQSVVTNFLAKHLVDLTDNALTKFPEDMEKEKKRRDEMKQQSAMEVDNPIEYITEKEPSHAGIKEEEAEVEHPVSVTPESNSESPEARAQRLLPHVTKAEFDSFQEYRYVAVKAENGFTVSKVKDTDRDGIKNEDDDLIPRRKHSESLSDNVIYTLKDFLKVPSPSSGFGDRDEWKLFCVAGNKDGKFIIQGGGKIHLDFAGRINASSFKLVFDNTDFGAEFIQWLVENPNQALSAVIERAIGQYTPDGRFERSYFPAEKVGGSFSSKNPFAHPINELRLARIDKEEQVNKNYRGTEAHQQLATELHVAQEAFNNAEKIRLEAGRAQRKAPSNPVATSQTSPQELNSSKRGFFGSIFRRNS